MPFIVNDPGHVAEHNRLAQALPPGFVPASTDSPALTGTPTAPTPANGDSSGSIATTEFVQEAAPSLNVRSFAAVGDGVTNDRAAIQAAIDAAVADGARTVVLPRGNYVVDVAPSKDYMLSVSAGVTLRGDSRGSTVIKVKASAGDYRAVIAGSSPSADLSGVVLENITIDQNTANNPVTTQANLFAGFPRYAFYAASGTGIIIRNCVFQNIDAVTTVAVNGTSVKNTVVTGCRFTGVGTSSATHDYSAVYIAGTGMTITDNIFEGTLGGKSSRTAIETHGAAQVVSGNRVHNFYTGMNITGVISTGSDNTVVTNNTLSSVLIGIHVWSYSGSNGLRNCDVSHNVMTIERDSWLLSSSDFPSGILLDPTSTQNFENLRIQSNTIVYNPFSATNQAGEYRAAGISLIIPTGIEVHNLDVLDNTVVGALSLGVLINGTVRRVRVSRNRFVDCGSSTESAMAPFYRAGVGLAGALYDVLVEGNRTFDTRATHKLAQGGGTSSITVASNCSQWDNTVACTDGVTLIPWADTVGFLFTTKSLAPAPLYRSTAYYGPDGGRSAVAQVANQMTCVPFWVGSAHTFDRIGAEVTVAGAGGTVVRLGIYSDNGSGMPGSLVVDAGTIAGDAVSAQEVSISVTLTPGLYWLAAVPQGGAPTMRVLAVTNILPTGVSALSTATATTPRTGKIQSPVSGALPSTFAATNEAAAPILVVLRAA